LIAECLGHELVNLFPGSGSERLVTWPVPACAPRRLRQRGRSRPGWASRTRICVPDTCPIGPTAGPPTVNEGYVLHAADRPGADQSLAETAF